MKIKTNLSMRRIGDEYVMIVGNGKKLDYTMALSLNETAAYLIEQAKGLIFTEDSWARLLTERYDIDFDRALSDVRGLLDVLREAEIIEE